MDNYFQDEIKTIKFAHSEKVKPWINLQTTLNLSQFLVGVWFNLWININDSVALDRRVKWRSA